MSVRRAAIPTLVAALIVAVAVPVATLRTFTIVVKCCCPSPAMCPHDTRPPPPTPCVRACHHTEEAIVAPDLGAFQPPAIAVATVEVRRAIAPAIALAAPHAPPPPARPAAPS